MPDPIRMPPHRVGGVRTTPPRQVTAEARTEPAVRTGWTTTAAPVDLDDLTDVDTTGESNGDVLTYDGNQWRPAPALTAGDHTHTQVAAANPWVIDHYLGFPPAGVRIHAADGTEIEAEVTYPIPASRVVVAFPYGVSLAGTAYLS